MRGGPGKAVAIGGGTGLPVVLHALLDLGFDTTAIVTMADDGGSSGLLREQLGMLPPGDVRNCLVAMAADENGLLSQLMQYRFPHGNGLSGHALGNLIIAALTDLEGSFPAAIRTVEELLGDRGRVLPSTLADVRLHGVDRAGVALSGQARLAVSSHPLACVHLEPESPAPYLPALEAIRAADAIVIAPGSLFTSIIPNFLVAGIAEAVRASSAKRVYVCNVANMRGETEGFDAADHVAALIEHGLEGSIDAVLVHAPAQEAADGDAALSATAVEPAASVATVAAVEPVAAEPEVIACIERFHIPVFSADLVDRSTPTRHSRPALRDLLGRVLG
ncbi:MAG: uridine diphosphate-N-acetylglucosamine-binding protein YvcK [Coriobacteriia bacterium]